MKALLAITLLLVGTVTACDHEGTPAKRPRSRSRTQVTCASDYECPGGACEREPRATYGICAWPDGGAPDVDRDGGSEPQDPQQRMPNQPNHLPDIQPGPNDIKI